MRRISRTRILRTLSILSVMLMPFAASAATNDQVDAAIKKAVAYINKSQQPGDNWEEPGMVAAKSTHWTGPTALACYALLVAGETPQSNPKLAAAIEWLKKNDTKGVYALGMRAQVWLLIPHDKDPSVRDAMKKDATLLLEGARNPKGANFRGLYHYLTTDLTSYDSSTSQYGVLGMWALERAGIEVPDPYWEAVENAWKKNQESDGGWNYVKGAEDKHPVMVTMTAAGIATLFITQDYLRSMEGIRCAGNVTNEPIAKGMKWMEDNLQTELKSNKVSPYGFYGIERIGVASGYKYFGTLDWYKAGADFFVKSQAADGSWNGFGGQVPSSAFGILFMCRGRAPVVMNKLQYDVDKKEGNWNQRPRDAANAVKYVASQMERDLNWQIVNLDVSVDELHDSPILYIAGSQALKFSPEDEAKLKQFVDEGGLILGQADCSEPAFAKSFKALGQKLFKGAGEFRKIEEDHPIYTREQFLAKNWKTKPDLVGLTNQVRELMLLIPSGDPGKTWQLGDFKAREDSFQLMSDIFLYAVEGKDLRNKGTTYIVSDDPRIKASKTLTVARIDAGTNPDPEPGGWKRLSSVIHNGFGMDVSTTLLKLEDPTLKDYKLASLTGTGKLKLSDAQQKDLKAYVDAGGTIIIDAAGGDTEYASSAEEMLHTIFGKDADQLDNAIPADNALYKTTGTAIGDIAFRPFARGKVPRQQTSPLLRGITINNRLAVIFSREDLSGGLVGESIDGLLGYTPDSATNLMRNVVLFTNGGAKPIPAPTTPAKPATPPAGKPTTPTTKPTTPPKTATTKPAAKK